MNLNELAVKEFSRTQKIKLHINCMPSITYKFIVNYVCLSKDDHSPDGLKRFLET